MRTLQRRRACLKQAGILSLAMWALIPATASAGGLYFYELSNASESGYGGAGMVARANDAGTVFSNPAGMTRHDDSAMLAGGIGVYIEAGFQTNSENEATGTSGHVNKRVLPAGSYSYLRPINDRWWAGVSLQNYFGVGVDWPDDWVGRKSSVNVALMAPQLQPTFAYKVNDWLSVGAGAALTLGYMSDKLRVDSLAPGYPDAKVRVSDSDFAVQGNFGIMLQPWDHTRIGLRYLTETKLDFKDDPNISWKDPIGQRLPGTDKKLDLGVKMPQSLILGVHHRWNDQLNVLGSFGWDEFSEFGRIQVSVDDSGIPSTTLNEDFRDTWHFGVGAEYQYDPDLQLTAGLSYDTSMSSGRTMPTALPLATLYRYAVGFKQDMDDSMTVGGGLSLMYEGNMSVEDNPGNGGNVNGKYGNAYIYFFSLYVVWN